MKTRKRTTKTTDRKRQMVDVKIVDLRDSNKATFADAVPSTTIMCPF